MRSVRFQSVLVLLFFSISISYGQAPFKVVGYLPCWNGFPASINNVDLTKITHLNIAFANPNSSGDLVLSNGTLANLATVVTAAHAKNVLVLISIGGANAPGSSYTTQINSNLSTFVSKMIQFTIDNNLDGIDVDIEGDVLDGTTMNSTQYENFVTALGIGLHAQNKLMTAALATWFANRVTNTAASKYDFINVMSYDAYGTWTGPGQHSSYSLAVSDLNYWKTTKGVPSSKLTVGVPFYGYYWGTGNSSITFNYITNNYPGSENVDQVTPSTGGIIYYNGIPTIKQKTALALNQAGGIMIWELTGDATGTKSLLSAIHEVAIGYASNTAPTTSITSPNTNANFNEGDTIQIDINAADSDGSIMKTEYFANTVLIGEKYGTPTTLKWNGAGPGSYSLTVRVTDNIGTSTTSSAVPITVTAAISSLPFGGTVFDIPGKIEAENFNMGGNNVGYSDLTTNNLGNSYRTGDVDIEQCVDNGGGYNVAWTDAGEWLEYTVNVVTTGNYDFQVRCATQNTSKSFYLELDGINISGSMIVPNTSGWQKWQTVTASNLALMQGTHKLRLKLTTGGYNVNYINTIVSTSTAIQQANDLSKQCMIYPNPVVQSSTLKFQLTHSGQTKISLMDEYGSEKSVLTNGFLSAGENQINFHKGNLPTGLYFCRISGEKETLFLKIMIE